MGVIIITGSSGLVGSESVSFFSGLGKTVVGIDNDMRRHFFGEGASTRSMVSLLKSRFPNFVHFETDIRNRVELENVFREFNSGIECVIHAAAQPSHDWAAQEPFTDFEVNALGTINMLEMTRRHSPKASFIFMSTNKVYGDQPNHLPLIERETRWTLDAGHPYAQNGIDESMSVDQALHSLFGASKLAADLVVQEYGRYFGMNTACFRAGCITGRNHAGAEQHGFLSYLMRCAFTGTEYKVYGYKGKQVRDMIHAADLARAFHEVFQSPRAGAVYNMGGHIHANCSVLEAIRACEERVGKKMIQAYVDGNRRGDHIWWISDTRLFQRDYPNWHPAYDMNAIYDDLFAGLLK